jgi:hypothetical protein
VRAAADAAATAVLRAQVIGPDKHGIKTIIEFKVKEDGTKARRVRRCSAARACYWTRARPAADAKPFCACFRRASLFLHALTGEDHKEDTRAEGHKKSASPVAAQRSVCTRAAASSSIHARSLR